MSRVKDIIQNRVLCAVEEGRTVSDVLRRMAEINVGAIMVLRDGQLRGVFSERDLMVRVVLAGLDPSATPVEQVMSTNLATVTEEATTDQAMEEMRRRSCRHLPVVRGPQVIGFLSMRDLMNYQLERQTEELHQMTAYIHGTV